eukprot:1195424-Prorocentrum_minimum.AAC.11
MRLSTRRQAEQCKRLGPEQFAMLIAEQRQRATSGEQPRGGGGEDYTPGGDRAIASLRRTPSFVRANSSGAIRLELPGRVFFMQDCLYPGARVEYVCCAINRMPTPACIAGYYCHREAKSISSYSYS